MWDSIYFNANLITLTDEKGYGVVEGGAIGIKDGEITFAGIPEAAPDTLAKESHDVDGKWITPGFIDCHTHLVYGGSRAKEFEMRLEGSSYEDIARGGGGILSTVQATREASEDVLFDTTIKRMKILMREGVCAFEIKSGYGLDTETEAKMLRVATRLRDETGLSVQRTFLGAHALPPEYKGRSDDYIDMVCNEMLPAIHAEGLIDAVDGFCENIAFSAQQMARVFDKAQELGLPVKLHAEQLSNQSGATMAAGYQALSSDHLEYLDEDGVKAMADAGSVAVILPGAYYFLRETQAPPIDLFRKHNVPMALATDHNPGSSPVYSLLLMMNMACTLFRMTPEEALRGVSVSAAKALGWNDMGVLDGGMKANFNIWDIHEPADLSYRIADNPIIQSIRS